MRKILPSTAISLAVLAGLSACTDPEVDSQYSLNSLTARRAADSLALVVAESTAAANVTPASRSDSVVWADNYLHVMHRAFPDHQELHTAAISHLLDEADSLLATKDRSGQPQSLSAMNSLRGLREPLTDVQRSRARAIRARVDRAEERRQARNAERTRADARRLTETGQSGGGYQSTVANLWVGRRLFLKSDHGFVGTIIDISGRATFENGTRGEGVRVRFPDGSDMWIPRRTVHLIYVTSSD